MSKSNIEDIYPLTPTQQGILYHCLLHPATDLYWTQYSALVTGPLDCELFQRAWDQIVMRHAILRTVFLWDKREQPLQVVRKNGDIPWERLDWGGLSAAEQENRFEEFLKKDRAAGYDLAKGPLSRFALIGLAPDRHRFVWSHHHLLLDGWSLQLVLNEAFEIYDRLVSGQPESSVRHPPFRNYVEWLLKQDPREAEKFFRANLAGVRAPTPLTVDRVQGGSPAAGAEFDTEITWLCEAETSKLKAFARAQKITLNTVVQAAWGLLLHRYSGEPDVLFGVTLSGRSASIEDVESTVGLFINTLPIRYRIDPAQPVGEWLRGAHQLQADLQQFQHAPLAGVQKLSEIPRGQNLFESIFVFENYPVKAGWKDRSSGISVGQVRGVERNNYPLTVVIGGASKLSIRVIYDTGRFTHDAARRMLGHMSQLLCGIASDPEARLGELPLLTESEQTQILSQWNDPERTHPADKTIAKWFEEQAARTPDAVAAVYEDQRLSYRELNERSNQLAHHLMAQGVQPDTLVGICMERNLDLVIGILGILKAGGAYLPLDLAYPKDRIAFILEDAQAPILLTQQKLVDGLAGHGARVVCLDGDWPAIARQPSRNPEAAIRPENLAYVIYTSGSTGKPKGSLITHANVVRLFTATQHWFHFNETDAWTLFHSYAFDFSVWEIWGALFYGGKLVVVPFMVSRSPEAFYKLLCQERVTVLNQTPSAFRQLIAAEESVLNTRVEAAMDPRLALRYVIFGGEALELRSLKPWFDRHGDSKPQLVNMYGITETTVHVTYRALSQQDLESGSVIGVPIPDLQVYLLDARRQLVPVGVPGEIHVGGAGLGRGYFNRPELTSERFIENPFKPGTRLYRSGDLARYLPGGDLEYLGRIDHQVKIRGFRVELGEIESVLNDHPAIRESHVIAREDTPGDKRLVAYLVPQNGEVPGSSELRDHLRAKLPDYMVPAAFVGLASLPLTNNGKVDRKALPAPNPSRPELGRKLIAPRTPVERTLAKIWSEVLRVEEVGIYDNFFELGGDSILSIQIIARARRAGVHITPKQFFEHQTIAELATLASEAASTNAEQGIVTGTAPLTPIEHWFFGQRFSEPHIWNQNCVLEVSGKLDRGALEQAFRSLLAHHDALRLKFTHVGKQWKQEFAAEAPAFHLEWVDLSAAPEEAQTAISATAARLQSQLNLSTGVMIRAAYFDLGPQRSHKLFIVIHHLAVDGVSWGILLEDLEAAYSQLARGQAVGLPAKTTSYRRWAERLDELARSGSLRAEQDYWLERNGSESAAITRDAAERGPNTAGSAQTISVELSTEETQALLQKVPAAYNTQINDSLLTALVLAFSKRTGKDSVLIHLEGHGREDISRDLEVSRTVGWFTSIFPVELRWPGLGGVGEALKAVKEQLRNVPNRGIGYGLLRYSSGDADLAAKLEKLPQPKIIFNYLGQFDRALDRSRLFKLSHESLALLEGSQLLRPHEIDVNAQVIEGRLRIGWSYSANLHRPETIGSLADAYLEALRGLIAHCQAPEAGGWTPSDFPLADLDQETVDRLAGNNRNVEAIYPLSPMQELFYTLEGANAQLGFEQWHYRLVGKLDASVFRKAWEIVMQRHSILRTSFVAEGLAAPVQIAHKHVTLPWVELDWRGASQEQLQERLRAHFVSARDRGFELTRAPLVRVVLIRTSDEVHHVAWSAHHLLLDGWSCPILLSEISQVYAALVDGREPDLPRTVSYQEYIAWLRRSDPKQEQQFWREMLAGFTAPTPIVGTGPDERGVSDADRFVDEEIFLPADVTQQIQAFVRQQQLTLNLLVQGAWAFVLRHQTALSDVVFGATFSGRPPELAGIESMVGPCVNNVPVRVKVANDQNLLEWLKSLQQLHFKISQHQYSSPIEIQGWSSMPWRHRLFESLLVFQNYRVDESATHLGSDVLLEPVFGPDRTNYSLTLMAFPGQKLRLRMIYDCRRISAESAHVLLEQTAALLSRIPAAAQDSIGKLISSLPAPCVVTQKSQDLARQRGFSVYVAPGTEMEKKIAAVWESAFQLDRIGIHDNFFELGGHSILMVQVHQRLQVQLGLQLSVAKMFQHPTIAALAKYLSEGQDEGRASTMMVQERAKLQREALARRRPALTRNRS